MTALNDYFVGTASKYLSAVDAEGRQHEIGSNRFTAILGNPGENKVFFEATYVFFDPDADDPEVCKDTVTFYDTRLNQPSRSPEYRLYYRDNVVTEQFHEGDFCLVGARTNGELLIATTRPGTEHERRLRYLFDIDGAREQWVVESGASTAELDLASRSIVDALGIELADEAENFLEQLVDKFKLTFPTTKIFSEFARGTLRGAVSPTDNPDRALEEWMKREEVLFRALERNIVSVRLKDGFDSVDDFVSFSLSVQNRRKSRVGHALENHLEAVFRATKIRYQRGAKTEGNAKPDFLFPDASTYQNINVSSPPLQMLAAKSTCKDRWRQILTEAKRIPHKHLFTLETAISESQTDEMTLHSVQLVVPPSVAKTYSVKQRAALMSLSELIQILPRLTSNS